MFAENSWYFRNALVRANYNNIKDGIYETTEFLEKFLKNFLLAENNELSNEEMHVMGNKANYDWLMESKEQLERAIFLSGILRRYLWMNKVFTDNRWKL